MKLSKILFIFLLTLSVVSCKKDDDGGSELFNLTNENLSGSYELTFFEATTVETTNVNGLDIVSIISNIGDTFDVSYVFAENGQYTAEGVFRIVTATVVNGEITNEDAFIETVSILNGSYSTTTSSQLLVLDGRTYEVTLFNETEVRITLEEIRTFQNGDTEVYTEELRFLRK